MTVTSAISSTDGSEELTYHSKNDVFSRLLLFPGFDLLLSLIIVIKFLPSFHLIGMLLANAETPHSINNKLIKYQKTKLKIKYSKMFDHFFSSVHQESVTFSPERVNKDMCKVLCAGCSFCILQYQRSMGEGVRGSSPRKMITKGEIG